MNFELHSSVKHMSIDEIDRLYERYISGERNKDLVEELKLDIHPNNLISVFPPLQHETFTCPYCEVPAIFYRPAKNKDKGDVHCPDCLHVVSNGEGGKAFCNCQKCADFRHEARSKAIDDKRAIISEMYDIDDISLTEYSKLSYKYKTYLLALLMMQPNFDTNKIMPLGKNSEGIRLSPTQEFSNEILTELFTSAVIVVDPDSALSSFDSDDAYETFFMNEVNWFVNVTFDGETRADMKDVFNAIYSELNAGYVPDMLFDVSEMVHRIAEEEVVAYLEVNLRALSLADYVTDKTRNMIRYVLKNFSVSNAYWFVRKAAESAQIFYAKGLATGKRHAVNTIPAKLMSLANHALDKNWDLYSYSRVKSIPRSELSIVLFGLIFEQGDEAGFNQCPVQFLDSLKSDKSSDDEAENSDDNEATCVECGSDEIKVALDGASLRLDCKSCGHSKRFTEQ